MHQAVTKDWVRRGAARRGIFILGAIVQKAGWMVEAGVGGRKMKGQARSCL